MRTSELWNKAEIQQGTLTPVVLRVCESERAGVFFFFCFFGLFDPYQLMWTRSRWNNVKQDIYCSTSLRRSGGFCGLDCILGSGSVFGFVCLCVLVSVWKVFLAVNHNDRIMISLVLFSCFSCSREARTHEAIESGHFCGSVRELWGVCVCRVLNCVCILRVSAYFHIFLRHKKFSRLPFLFIPPDWDLCDKERTPPAKNYLVQRWPAPPWDQGQERGCVCGRISWTERIQSSIFHRTKQRIIVAISFFQTPTWSPHWWRRPLVSTLSRAPCSWSPPRQTRTLSSSAPWSTACQETRTNRRNPTPSTSTSTVSVRKGWEYEL